MIMIQEMKIKLTLDLEILCDVFCISPEELLQGLMNQISLPRYMNSEKNELLEAATTFVFFHAPTHDAEEMLEHFYRHLHSKFCNEIENEVIPGPEAEDHIRRIVMRWYEAVCKERKRMNSV